MNDNQALEEQNKKLRAAVESLEIKVVCLYDMINKPGSKSAIQEIFDLQTRLTECKKVLLDVVRFTAHGPYTESRIDKLHNYLKKLLELME